VETHFSILRTLKQELKRESCLAGARGAFHQKKPVSSKAAKDIVKAVKDSKRKVQASIQGDVVRISGKDRDDLQAIITLLKSLDLGIDMQFTNYRS
jgi:hypothetical protein